MICNVQETVGPTYLNPEGEAEAVPLAEGKTLVVAPETEHFRMIIESQGSPLLLLDGSLKHNNGWFVVHSLREILNADFLCTALFISIEPDGLHPFDCSSFRSRSSRTITQD